MRKPVPIPLGTLVLTFVCMVSLLNHMSCTSASAKGPHPTKLPNAVVNVYYDTSMPTNGGISNWTITSGTLPPGLSLANTVIAGTPADPGTYTFTAVGSGKNQKSPTEQTFSIAVVTTPPLTITSTSLAGGTVGASYSQALSASGGTPPYSWSVTAGALPAGLTLSTSGTISGYPTTAGQSSFTVQVADASSLQQFATQALSISISSVTPALQITTLSLPGGSVGAAYQATLAATGGTIPYSWNVSSGQLPAGLSLDASTGAISGSPTQSGSNSFTIQVADSSSPQLTASHSYTVTVTAAGATLDQYGGRNDITCAGGAQNFFYTERISNRWWLCTPLGHGYFQQGVQLIAPTDGLDYWGRNNKNLAVAKYGNTWEGWADATAQRLLGWGFNSIDVGSNAYIYPYTVSSGFPVDSNGLRTIPTKLPMIESLTPAKDAVRNASFGTDNSTGNKVLLTEGAKNLVTGWSALYPGWRYGLIPDYYDTRVYTILDEELDPNTHLQSLSDQFTSPYFNYVIGLSIEDGDQMGGAGFGTEPSYRNPYTGPEAGWTLSTMAPVMTAYNNTVQGIYMYSKDTTVYSKQALRDWLAAKYGTIGAMNSAWGSNYTSFDSTGTLITGESVGTPTGSTATFDHTIAQLTPSRFSTQVLVNGTPIAGDPGNDSNVTIVTSGNIHGPQINGSITYGTGALSVTFSMASVNLNRCQTDGSTVTVESTLQHGLWTGAKVTISGTTNYNVTNATIAVLDPWHFTYAKSGTAATEYAGSALALLPQAGDSITVNYVQNGYRIGTGFMDEDGRNSSWIGTDPQFLSNTAANVAADFRSFLVSYAGFVFGHNESTLHNRYPGLLYIAQIGGWSVPPRAGTLDGAAPYLDLFQASDQTAYTQNMIDFMYQHWNKPWLQGIYTAANPDSAMFPFAGPLVMSGINSQEDKGQRYSDMVSAVLNASFTATGVHPYVGLGVWSYFDMQNEATNWGLVTWGDNAYDGHEDVVASNVACSPPFTSITMCGGEPAYPSWQANTSVAIPGGNGSPGNRIQVSIGGTYYMFEVTVAGRTGGGQPSWPTTLNATVNDGTSTWKNVGTKTNPSGFGNAITKTMQANTLWQQ